MSERSGIFEGDDPFVIVRRWMEEATEAELNDPNAIALSTVDATGLPNARMVLLKEVEDGAFVFYTNYGSAKAQELGQCGQGRVCDALEIAAASGARAWYSQPRGRPASRRLL